MSGLRQATPQPPAAQRLRWLAVAAWSAALVAYLVVAARTGSGPLDVLLAVTGFLREHPAGAVAYLLVYALRPLLFFPATLLTVGAGVLYGPIAGVGLVVLGANLSATVAFLLGRSLGAELAGKALAHPRLVGMARRLRANAFEAVLTLRFVFAPYDAVNYLAGALRLPLKPFVAATAIGSLPGTLVFVLFGAGLSDLAALEEGRLPSPDATLLAASAALFVASLALARAWRARERARELTREGARQGSREHEPKRQGADAP